MFLVNQQVIKITPETKMNKAAVFRENWSYVFHFMFRTLTLPCTFGTKASLVLWVDTVEKLVPDLQEKPAVVRSVH